MEHHSNLCAPDQIAALARNGDLAALDRLTRCYGERLLAAGRRYCADTTDPRDAVQDALLSAGQHLVDWRGTGPLESWVVRMVARACAQMRRGRKNDPARHDADAEPVDPMPGPEDEAARAELAGRLGVALSTLAPAERAMIILADAEGWTGPEIAARVGLRPDAVRARISRARRKLRARLEPIGI